jgi:hypothetical protein
LKFEIINYNKTQIIKSLISYHNRPLYIQILLYNLCKFSMCCCENITAIIGIIVDVMRNHSKIIGIQLAATACLYNLIRDNKRDQISNG